MLTQLEQLPELPVKRLQVGLVEFGALGLLLLIDIGCYVHDTHLEADASHVGSIVVTCERLGRGQL